MSPIKYAASLIAASLLIGAGTAAACAALGIDSPLIQSGVSLVLGGLFGFAWSRIVPMKRRKPKRETVTVWAEPRQLIAERTDLHFDLHDEQGTAFMHLLVFRDGAGCIGGIVIPRRLVEQVGERVLVHAARTVIEDMEA